MSGRRDPADVVDVPGPGCVLPYEPYRTVALRTRTRSKARAIVGAAARDKALGRTWQHSLPGSGLDRLRPATGGAP